MTADIPLTDLLNQVRACRVCEQELPLGANPVLRAQTSARILIIGQAPGTRVHATGIPWNDPSGDRLRDWMGVNEDLFYDRSKLAIVPMAFCFPGYDAKGSDLPPPKICAETWHQQVLSALKNVRLTLLVGGYAHGWHLGRKAGVTETVAAWRDLGPDVIPLPHPSWRNTAWLKKHPWFEAELLPVLRARVVEVLA